MTIVDYVELKEPENVILKPPKKTSNVLVIDLGSFMFRAGPSNSPSPTVSLIPKIYRPPGQSSFLITNPTPNQKVTQRTPWDAVNTPLRLMSNYGCLNILLENIFNNLPVVDSSTCLIISEPLGQLPSIRREIFRILKTNFSVTKVHFGIDSIFTFQKYSPSPNCILLNFGHSSVEITILLNGKIEKDASRRIEWGEEGALMYLKKLLHLKYPNFPHKIGDSVAQSLLKNHCYVAPSSYDEEVADVTKINKTVQFPYYSEGPLEKERRERAAQDLSEKRRAQGEVLRERIKKDRDEKIKRKKVQLEKMKELLSSLSNSKTNNSDSDSDSEAEAEAEAEAETESETQAVLLKFGYSDKLELEAALEEEERALLKLEGKDLPKEEIDFGLLDVDDAELDQQQLRKKRMLRLQRSGIEARLKKEEERKKKLEEEQELRTENELLFKEQPLKWRENLLLERRSLLNDLQGVERRRRNLLDRKSLSSTSRLKNAMSLIGGNGDSESESDAEDHIGNGAVRKSEGNGGGGKGSKAQKKKRKTTKKSLEKKRKEFGDNEDDWLVYRREDDFIDGGDVLGDFAPTGPEGSGNPQTLEEVWQARVEEIESELLQNVGPWWEGVRREEWMSQRSELDILRDPMGNFSPFAKVEDLPMLEGRMELNVERVRVWEPIFQPKAMVGLEQNGLIESIVDVLSLPSIAKDAHLLLENVLLVGGLSNLSGLKERLYNELRPFFDGKINLSVNSTGSVDPWLDSWRGASDMVVAAHDHNDGCSDGGKKYSITYCTTEEEAYELGFL